MTTITVPRAVLEQALAAMDKATRFMSDADYVKLNQAIAALRALLAQQEQEQEPVAWMYVGIKHDGTTHGPHLVWKPQYMDAMSAEKGAKATPLYTTPPRREWQSLSKEEIWEDDRIMAENARCGLMMSDLSALARAIEAALKEKNHG